MSNTSSIKINLLRSNATISAVTDKLFEKNEYTEYSINPVTQQQTNTQIRVFISSPQSVPPWYNLIHDYLSPSRDFSFQSHSFVGIVEYSGLRFAICGGGGAHKIAEFLDYSFGISVLERMFNPDVNKIEMVNDRGIIGDVLASSRFYRRARSLQYEDDFGKYFQKIEVKFTKQQIELHLPSLAAYKGDKLLDEVAVSGSSSVEVTSRVDFITLLGIVKELFTLLQGPSNPIFNTSLVPVDARKDKNLVARLVSLLMKSVRSQLAASSPFDFDICHRYFEDFFRSDSFRATFPVLTINPTKLLDQWVEDDILPFRSAAFLRSLYLQITNSSEYRGAANPEAFVDKFLAEVNIETVDIEGRVTTSGRLTEYIQSEIVDGTESYFLLDSVWYSIKPQFDQTLSEKFVARVAPLIIDSPRIPVWPRGLNEHQYNATFSQLTESIVVHPLKVDNIEICDAIVVDTNTTYLVYVKDGLDASTRDLTSQVFIGSRIVENERRTKEKPNLKKLYDTLAKADRFDSKKLTWGVFLELFCTNRICYCLVVRPKSGSSTDVKLGKFDSRIAKVSLYEYSAHAFANELGVEIVVR